MWEECLSPRNRGFRSPCLKTGEVWIEGSDYVPLVVGLEIMKLELVDESQPLILASLIPAYILKTLANYNCQIGMALKMRDELYYHVERNELVAVEHVLKTHNHLSNILFKNRPLLAEPCRRGHNDMVRLLLNCGVNPNNCSKSGVSPVWEAVFGQHEDTVRIMVESGADIEMNCLLPNFRCLDYAIVFGFYEISLYLYQITTNKQLKTPEEYQRIKCQLGIGRYVNYPIMTEGLQSQTPPNQMPDHLKCPKVKEEAEEDCSSWCCGLFVFKPKRDLPQPQSGRELMSANDPQQ